MISAKLSNIKHSGFLRWCGVILLLSGLNACSPPPPPLPEEYLPKAKLKVVATTVPLALLAREIGGDAVTVECLMEPIIPETDDKRPTKPGAPPPSSVPPPPWNPNPFSWNLTASSLLSMKSAHLVLINGLGLEGSLESRVEEIRSHGVVVVVVGDSIPKEDVLPLRSQKDRPDPCIWNSPRLWKHAVKAVNEGLGGLVVEEARPYFERRKAPIPDRLNRLEEWVEGRFAQSYPKGKRFLLVSHDSLQYFARDFGIESRAFFTAAGEPLPGDEAELRAWLKKNEVRDFVPDTVSPAEPMVELARRFELHKTLPIYSIMLGRPGQMEMGLIERCDIGTTEGSILHMTRIMERRLAGPKKLEFLTKPKSEPEEPKADKADQPDKPEASAEEK